LDRLDKERGQVLVEFALVLPVLVLIVLAIIEFGIAFNDYLRLPSSAVCPVASMPCHKTLDFDQDGFQLLALNSASDDRPTAASQRCNWDVPTMRGWLSNGYPGDLPVNQYYCEHSGSKNGIKQGIVHDGTTATLIPVYQPGSYDPATGTVHVIGFAAFVIDSNGDNGWDNGNGGHKLTGTVVNYLAEGVPAPPGGSQSFGTFAVGLDG
jgi:hypothetical protein